MHDGLAPSRALNRRLRELLPALRRAALWELGPAYASHADDVVQVAVFKALREGPLPDGDGALRWLKRFVFNVARNLARCRKCQRKHLRHEHELPDAVAENDTGAEPSRALAVIALRDGALGRALDELDPMERAVLLAVEVDELSEREVARELGVSPWKVHDRLQSAKEKLRRAA